MDNTAQATAEVNAQLRRDFSALEPAIGNVIRREFGDARISVGLLSLTRSVTKPDEVLPETYTEVQTAAVYSSDSLRFPRFNLLPENIAFKLITKAAQLVLRVGNFGKVDFSSHPDFARLYRVHALDPEGTRWHFDDRVLALLAGRPGLNISASNGSLLLYRAGTEIPRDGLQAFANQAVEVFRAFEAAARRPGAARPTGTPKTDQELLAKQMSGFFGEIKILPAVTLAEAIAFIQQPPPRAMTPGIERYYKERASPIAAIFGGVTALAGVLFLLVGGSQVPWYAQILLVFLFLGGGSTLIWGLVARLRARRLLLHGRAGSARIETMQNFDSRVDGTTMTRLELQVEADGAVHRATCLLPAAAADRLKAVAAEKRSVPVLYSAGNPGRVLIADELVQTRDMSL
jgi:hypothetical protein